ncbi:MAG: hypothetical protein CVU28_06370 [Betaproteobacteria bacterium HGW-Betaproteobacteria-21]|nr:MAG: hypothetical protein CVU28_06370 [Betaproteobacteria bacterium HGW-Betaproteobacteria-21]
MQTLLKTTQLQRQNQEFMGTGGRSEENRPCGFRPAFMDIDTHTVYESRFADGRPAPIHVLDGLPDELVVARSSSGRIAAVKASVIAGFVLATRFYNREEAAHFISALVS